MIKTLNRSHKEIYDELRVNGNIIFECITGSQCYGTATPESDIDKRFVYILPEENLFGLDYIEQLNLDKDHYGYEIKRFIELAKQNNPNILELLFMPIECIEFCHPVFQLLLEERMKFITKMCKYSFGGYARSQIQKASNQNKMMNWEKEKIERKTPLDFCYQLTADGKTIPIVDYLNKMAKTNGRTINEQQKLYGLVKLDHTKYIYAVYYDPTGTLGYSGFLNEEMTSNELRLSSIPKGEVPIFNIFYNQEAYMKHCSDYKKYQIWLKERNPQRWVDVENHGQMIDGKNMLHSIRLIQMGLEIAEGKGLIVKRPNAEELLNIRKGKVNLEAILASAEEKIKLMDAAFEKSDLPDSVDHQFANELLIKIRKIFYQMYSKKN